MKSNTSKKILAGVMSFTLATAPLTALADSSFTGKVKVYPKIGLYPNFDSFSFEGAVGDSNLAASYSLGGVTVSNPEYKVRAKSNYSVMISGSDFTNSDSSVQLDIERLSAKVTGGGVVSISSVPTQIDASPTGLNTTKGLNYTLDLTDTGNSYSDNDVLSNLDADLDVTTTVVLSFTGL